MPVRTTSKASHFDNEEKGFNSSKRAKIFSYIMDNPMCSRADLARSIPGMTINCATGRVRELVKANLIEECGCKHDPHTGKSVNCLRVTEIKNKEPKND